ncbi:ABC transporter permease [Brevibacillus sp. SYP-B805]|uniref:ABC transporter permease n=1 Tax=Brevibacillus sp. SYP-B805 TaxID=1578199 RepID=UPI0013E9E377|nr:ABC transporter permease subunit [Brevibacillus sp. SYP-B805]NGQ93898.1 ABC transporter permease [Brevibacillus sp. SYP-B805]
MHPFWVIVQKEIADHLRSWRFLILVALLFLTCIGSLYTAMSTLREAVSKDDAQAAFLFLKLFTVSDGTLPPFITFVGFLGPLFGIAMGFDAINAERNKGTLSRLLSQPIYRDYVINAKFVAALIVISALLFALGFLVMGMGLIAIGIPPTPEEFGRLVFFLIVSVLYVSFWLNMAILFSTRFRQASTSALAAIAVWLFFSVFYPLIVNLIANATFPKEAVTPDSVLSHQQFVQALTRLSPSQLFSEATTTMLTPSVRSLGPLTMEQIYGAIPSPLPLGQSLLLIWPQSVGLLAATAVCFALSYILFMRQEIRSRN